MYNEAQKHFKECNGCEHCVWFEESAYNISEYSAIIKPIEEKHPLYNLIKEKFNGKEIN